jgi:hypothetical protein
MEGNYICERCGARLNVADDAVLTVVAGTLGKRNVRIVAENGKAIHRCEVRPSGPRHP